MKALVGRLSETSRMADRDVKKLEKRRVVIERDMKVLKATMTTTTTTTKAMEATCEENQRLLEEMAQKIVIGDPDMETHQQVISLFVFIEVSL